MPRLSEARNVELSALGNQGKQDQERRKKLVLLCRPVVLLWLLVEANHPTTRFNARLLPICQTAAVWQKNGSLAKKGGICPPDCLFFWPDC